MNHCHSACGDHEMPVGVAHRAARVRLRSTRRPARHLGHEVLEAGFRKVTLRFFDARIGFQSRVVHDPVDEIVDEDRNPLRAAQPLVQRRLVMSLHQGSLVCEGPRNGKSLPEPTVLAKPGPAAAHAQAYKETSRRR